MECRGILTKRLTFNLIVWLKCWWYEWDS